MKNLTLQPKTHAQLTKERDELERRLSELEGRYNELHQLIDSLQESEEKYRILLDESSNPIFTFYPDGTYRYVNQAFANGVGRNIDEIIGRKIWDVFPKEEADKRYSVLSWVFEHGETRVFEVRVPGRITTCTSSPPSSRCLTTLDRLIGHLHFKRNHRAQANGERAAPYQHA